MSGIESHRHNPDEQHHHDYDGDQHHHDHHRHDAQRQAENSSRTTSGQTYNVEGRDCGHCVETVEKAVTAVPGVASAAVDLVPDGVSRLTVSGSPDESALREAVTAAGYGFSR
jgi:copper chaperone CopZ